MTRVQPLGSGQGVLLVVVLLALMGFGYAYYLDQRHAALGQAQARLQVIADQKVQAVARWLRERRGDADTLLDSSFGETLRALLADPGDLALQQRVIQWMGSRNWSYGYSALAVLEPGGRVVLSLPWIGTELQGAARATLDEALARDQVLSSDLYGAQTDYGGQEPRLDYIVPVPSSEPGMALGALLLRIDPKLFLFPLVGDWPIPSDTGEALLLRPEGDTVHYLSPPRHGDREPLELVLSLERGELPLAQALGRTGTELVSGRDYRGEPVLAAVRAVPLSDWYLVAKLDRAEILAPVLRNVATFVVLAALLMGFMGLGFWGMRRRQAAQLYSEAAHLLEDQVRDRTAALEEANVALRGEIDERLRAERRLELWGRVIAASSNGVFVTDPGQPDNPIIMVNPAFERITGHAGGDVLGLAADGVLGQEPDQPRVLELQQALRDRRETQLILRSRRKDGTPFWCELFLAPVRDESGQDTHCIGVLTDISERKAYEEELEHQANHDSLTGLPNRNLLMDRIRHAVLHAQRVGRSVALLFLDLDRFKMVNDSMGHSEGDALLQSVAQRLRQCVRADDTVARLGGDEFVVVLEGLGRDTSAAGVAAKVLESLRQPFHLGGQEFFLGGSIGISLYPQDGETPDTLLKNADTAMYRAKDQGRNQIRFYAREMNARTLDRLVMEKNLRYALERDELELHYQPQVALSSNRIIGLEALLRWRHPQLGAIAPHEFIPLAEETGLIVPIGEWVIRTACAQARDWQAAGIGPLRVAVNLSPHQFTQSDLAGVVLRVLGEAGMNADSLELEITEGALMRDVDQAIGILRRFKDMGVHLAVDDFGTGYSSLGYLKRFPLDRLKIDRSFVQDVPDDADDAAITVAVIALAHSLRLKVIAEGVETKEQLQFLKARDCDEVQGYYFSRPLPAGQLGELLARLKVG